MAAGSTEEVVEKGKYSKIDLNFSGWPEKIGLLLSTVNEVKLQT